MDRIRYASCSTPIARALFLGFTSVFLANCGGSSSGEIIFQASDLPADLAVNPPTGGGMVTIDPPADDMMADVVVQNNDPEPPPEVMDTTTPFGPTLSLPLDSLIGRMSFSYTFAGTSDVFVDTINFSESNIVTLDDGSMILDLVDGNSFARCGGDPQNDSFLCFVGQVSAVENSSLVTYDYLGGPSGRGWFPVGAITFDRSFFGSEFAGLNDVIVDWRFAWMEEEAPFGFHSIDTSTGSILEGDLFVSPEGVLRSWSICAGSTFDLSAECEVAESAPYILVNNNRWRASTPGSGDGEADDRRGNWFGPRTVEAQMSVVVYRFGLESETQGSGVFEFCSGLLGSVDDRDNFSSTCAGDLIPAPDGGSSVVIEPENPVAAMVAALSGDLPVTRTRSVNGQQLAGEGLNDYKRVYDQATPRSTPADGNASIYRQLNPNADYVMRFVADAVKDSLTIR